MLLDHPLGTYHLAPMRSSDSKLAHGQREARRQQAIISSDMYRRTLSGVTQITSGYD